MNHQDFLHGREFYYSGSFMRLARHPLYYDAGLNQVIDRTLQSQKTNDDEYAAWDVLEIRPDAFVLFKKCFGKLIMPFKDCRLKEPLQKYA